MLNGAAVRNYDCKIMILKLRFRNEKEGVESDSFNSPKLVYSYT
jgi:hypothetical protein